MFTKSVVETVHKLVTKHKMVEIVTVYYILVTSRLAK